VLEGEQRGHVVELGGEPQRDLLAQLAAPGPGDRLRQRPGDVLDAERVGVAGQLEGGALVAALGGAAGDVALPGVAGDLGEYRVEVGVSPGEGGPVSEPAR